MSVNYYLDFPYNEDGHLGKQGGGYFTAKAPKGVDSFDQWAAQMDGRKIFAESGYEVTRDEMVETATKRDRFAMRREPRYDKGEFVERGVLFVRHTFF